MINVLLVAQILVSIVLIVVVLMQRSEGGALGLGSGGAGGGLMSGRGVAGALVRVTIIFGAIFFVTSLGLTTLAGMQDRGGKTAIEQELESEFEGPAVDDVLGIEGLGDLRTPDLTLSDDPLAVSPSAPAPQPEPGAPTDETPATPQQ